MGIVTFRELISTEAGRVLEIDRAEEINGVYVLADGELVLRSERISVPGWNPATAPDYPRRIREVLSSGGVAFGAYDGTHLVGIGVLDVLPVGGDPAVMALDLLHVGAGHRGRGIGKQLTALIVERARALGATALYISATPTWNTVDAYLRMGAWVLASPDPEKFALEPEDIHLLMPIGNDGDAP
ncbi:MAG: GNAT family N-acetyltransferase [Thermomicrobiales bacterium]